MTKKYCINCGVFIIAQANFCSECGAPQHGEEAGSFRANQPVKSIHAATVSTSEDEKQPHENSAHDTEIIQNIERRHLKSTVIISFMLSYVATTSILLVLLGIAIFFQIIYGALALAIYFFAIYISALIEYNNFFFSADDNGFQSQSGVIHIKTVTIPYQQIQNVNIKRSLTDRILGLSRVYIETAGNSGDKKPMSGGYSTTSEGYLPGVSLESAKHIHDLLLSRAQNNN